MRKEQWKNIIGFEQLYKVSNFGNIVSLPKPKGFYKIDKQQPRKTKISKLGYENLTLLKESKLYSFSVHRLVANHFISNPDNLPQVNNIDGNKLNNNVNNLEWCTSSYNLKHAFKLGLRDGKGEKHNGHKLTNKDVLFIRNSKLKNCELADMFNISRSNVTNITKRNSWKHL